MVLHKLHNTHTYISRLKPDSQSTQVGKGSSEEKKYQRILTSKFVKGMFMWFKIAQNKKIHGAILEGRWYTGRKLRQIWAEWAVHASCYLQKGITFYFNIGDLGFYKGPLSHFY